MVNLNCTKSFLFDLKCTKIASGWGSAPDPTGGAYGAPPDPLAVRGRGEGREGEGREGQSLGWQGKAGEGICDFPLYLNSWICHWLYGDVLMPSRNNAFFQNAPQLLVAGASSQTQLGSLQHSQSGPHPVSATSWFRHGELKRDIFASTIHQIARFQVRIF